MNRTPFSLALNSMDLAMAKPPQTHPGAPIESPEPPGKVRIGLKGECRSPAGSPLSWGYRSRFYVGLVCQLHHGPGGPAAGHPSALMRAVDPSEADVIIHHELPGLGSVVGPGTMKLPVV